MALGSIIAAIITPHAMRYSLVSVSGIDIVLETRLVGDSLSIGESVLLALSGISMPIAAPSIVGAAMLELLMLALASPRDILRICAACEITIAHATSATMINSPPVSNVSRFRHTSRLRLLGADSKLFSKIK